MEKFVCKIDPKIIYDLNNQISKNRIINWAPDYNDQAGISFDDLSYILDYWKNKFSWTNEEEKLNKFNQYVFQYDNVKTHFLHIKSNHKNSIPLLLIHGWPGSIFEFNDLIPLLTSPDKNDLKNYLAFDLIIPSLPNVGFSFSPKQKPLDLNEISKHFIKLMKTLDYQKYFIQGGDLGSFIASIMAVNVPKEVMGIHLNLLPLPRGLNNKPNNIEEENYYEKLRYFMKYETGYQQIQGTKPFTLAHALNASPVALCSYISEKFYTWTDNKGSLFSHINIDTMLANISLYWITGCIGASFWPYYARHRSDWPIDIDNPITVPMGYSEFPKEIFSPPNSLASQFYKNILLWEKHNSGGHFAAMEKPKELASDVNKFVKDVI